jgi:hypothetical protein
MTQMSVEFLNGLRDFLDSRPQETEEARANLLLIKPFKPEISDWLDDCNIQYGWAPTRSQVFMGYSVHFYDPAHAVLFKTRWHGV